MGEITVLALAGIGVFAMIQGLNLNTQNNNQEGFVWSEDKHPLMMQTLTEDGSTFNVNGICLYISKRA